MPTYATTHFFHLMVRIKDYSICILGTKLHFLFLRPMTLNRCGYTGSDVKEKKLQLKEFEKVALNIIN